MLSDSNSTQDPFTDAASSQDSSHKVHSGKGGASSPENTTPTNEGQPRGEDTGRAFFFFILLTHLLNVDCMKQTIDCLLNYFNWNCPVR